MVGMSKDKVMIERSELSADVKIDYTSVNWKQTELIRKKVSGYFHGEHIWEAWEKLNKVWGRKGIGSWRWAVKRDALDIFIKEMVNRTVWAWRVSMVCIGSQVAEEKFSWLFKLCCMYPT